MTPRGTLLWCLVLLVALVAGAAPTAGSAHYDVSLSPSLDVPDRNATFAGEPYAVSELGRVARGEVLVATVDVENDTDARLVLYDEDRNVVGGDEGTGDTLHGFTTGNRSPGTYVVALRVGDRLVDLEPAVVSAYNVSVEAPEQVTAGSTFYVRANLTAVEADGAPYRVQVVVGDGRERVRTTLTRESGLTYSGSVDASALQPGTYSLHVVAQDIEQLFDDEKVVLGASDLRSLRVVSPATTGEDGSNAGGDGGGGAGGGGSGGGAVAPPPAPAPGPTTAGSTTSTDAPTGTPREPTAGRRTTSGGTSGVGGSPPGDSRADPTDTDSAGAGDTVGTTVSTPSPSTTTPGQSLGVWVAVAAIVLAALLALRRR